MYSAVSIRLKEHSCELREDMKTQRSKISMFCRFKNHSCEVKFTCCLLKKICLQRSPRQEVPQGIVLGRVRFNRVKISEPKKTILRKIRVTVRRKDGCSRLINRVECHISVVIKRYKMAG